MDWNNIWTSIKDFFTNNIWSIVKFVAVLVIGIIAIKILINIIKRLLNKTKAEKITQNFLVAILKFGLYLILVLALLSIIGINVTGVVTALSACVLAIGVALQNIIANLANGIVIVANHMFKKGDFISINGFDGSVVDIHFLFTTIQTTDNKRITIPNSAITNNAVINAGANPTRRVDFTFSVAYETDVELVKKIVIDVMKSNGNVYDNDEHKPFCRLKTLGASSIDFFANCWVDSSDYWDSYYYIIENVYNEFKRNGISIPYNQIEVRNREDNVVMPVISAPLQERVEKVRNTKKHISLEDAGLKDIFHKRHKESSGNTTKTA
jgi:small conductance mechanosensitive channel